MHERDITSHACKVVTILKRVQNNRIKHNKTIQCNTVSRNSTQNSYKHKHQVTNLTSNIYDIDSHALMTMYMAFLCQILSKASFYTSF